MNKLKNALVLCVMVLAAASWVPLANADTLSAASRVEIEPLLSKLKMFLNGSERGSTPKH